MPRSNTSVAYGGVSPFAGSTPTGGAYSYNHSTFPGGRLWDSAGEPSLLHAKSTPTLRYQVDPFQSSTATRGWQQSSSSSLPRYGSNSAQLWQSGTSASVSQQPYQEVVYKRNAPRPAPLSSAPFLVEASYREGYEKDMIYVECEVGNSGTSVEMLVDTGAQMSVISSPLVQQLRLEDQVDFSRGGVASGVGHARIVGCLQGVPVRLGSESGVEFALDFSVLDVHQDLLMLGIDQLRRFECIIDLQRQCLVFGGQGGTQVNFLPPDEDRARHWRAACPMM